VAPWLRAPIAGCSALASRLIAEITALLVDHFGKAGLATGLDRGTAECTSVDEGHSNDTIDRQVDSNRCYRRSLSGSRTGLKS